jgi:integrase/recombinase XerD
MRTYTCQPLPGDPSDPQGLTALVDRYLLWMETHHYALGTVQVRRVTLSHFLRWCLERSLTRPATLTPEILERFQRHVYYYRQRNGQPLSLSSQSHRLTALRSWCAWLVQQHVLAHDPARELVLPRGEQRLPRQPLAVAEVEAVLAQADLATPHGLRNRALLEVIYSTALRRAEALRLEHADLDRERRTVLVRRGKGQKDRVVPLGQRALAWLDKYLAEARPLLARHVDSPLLFVSKNGHPLHPNQLSKLVRDYLRGAGVTKAGAAHLFRHTTATLMLDAGADVRFIQALLGHVKLSTTAIYTHVSIAQLRAVHERTHPARLFRLPGAPQPPASPPPDDDEGDLLWVPVA